MTTINWSGYNWEVKSGIALGPGPNNWSNSPDDVYVDIQGNLHLKISNKNNTWYCTEIISVDSFGYGIFEFNVSPILYMDSNVVLGLFTYSDDCHEIDIEYSKWGDITNNTDAGFTVQPIEACINPYGNIYNQYNNHRFNIPLNQSTTGLFRWTSSIVNFNMKSTNSTIEWSSNKYVPQYPTTLPTKVHLNLWLYKGMSPSDSLQQEVIIKSFKYSKSNCSTDNIEILGKCIPKNALIIGGIGTVTAILLTKKLQT